MIYQETINLPKCLINSTLLNTTLSLNENFVFVGSIVNAQCPSLGYPSVWPTTTTTSTSTTSTTTTTIASPPAVTYNVIFSVTLTGVTTLTSVQISDFIVTLATVLNVPAASITLTFTNGSRMRFLLSSVVVHVIVVNIASQSLANTMQTQVLSLFMIFLSNI